MSRVYFFGDSITFGTGCTPDEEYYHKYGGPDKKMWPDIVSEYFNSAKFNLALPGSSTPTILNDFYSAFNDIIPSVNKVVLFKGFYDRIDLISNDGQPRVLHQFGTNNKDTYNNNHFSEEELDLIGRYGVKYLMDNPFRIRLFEQTIHYISTTLDRLGIDNIIWGPNELDPLYALNRKFRLTIHYATNGEIEDYHFSYEGHRLFAEWVINQFNKKYNYKKSKLIL